MTSAIPDEAVQAAQEATEGGFGITDDYMRRALIAALPFLQGVKVDAQGIYDYVQGYEWRGDNGDYTPNDADREMLEDAIVGYLSAIEPDPSPRAQALEEAAKIALDVSENGEYHGEASVDSTSSIYQQGAFEVYEALRALSSQPVADGVDSIEVTPSSVCVFADMGVERPVADGWLPIESAPKDGTVIQVWHQVHKCPISVLWKDDGFPYRGERLNWYERSYTTAWPESAFTHWRPLPASPGASDTRPAAPVEGLETQWNSPRELLKAFGAYDIREGSRSVLGDGIEEDGEEDYLEAPVHVLEKMLAELVTRSQAEAIIAAKDKEIRELKKLISSTHKTPVKHLDCKNIHCPICEGGLFVCADCGAAEIETEQRVCSSVDNVALTARVKELDRCHEGTVDLCNQKSVQIEALETQLAAARKGLKRQGDNMAFALNHNSFPEHWYLKFTKELEEDRAALEAKP